MAGAGEYTSAQESSSSAEEGGFSIAIEGDSSPSESGSHDDEDDEDEDGDDESSPADDSHQGGMFDLEAAEDDGRSESESESADIVHYSFPQFAHLPIELRRQIWEAFCPDLIQPARLYRFITSRGSLSDRLTVGEHPHFDQQIAPTRTLLAVHHESREIALAAFPDTLAIHDGQKIVRFNKDTDVVMINQFDTDLEGLTIAHDPAIPGFSDIIKNIAFDLSDFINFMQHDFTERMFWRQLDRVYFVLEDSDCRLRHLRWCPSKSANQYLIQDEEDDTVFLRTFQLMYCWPNLNDHLDFAAASVPRDDLLSSAAEVGAEFGLRASGEQLDSCARERGVDIWPMILFSGANSMMRFENLAFMDENQEWLDSESEEGATDASDQESGTDLDEYESDGIDDGDIDDQSSDNEDEDDLAVLPISDDLSAAEGFSPLAEYPPESIGVGFDPFPQAQFSSPEAESETARDVDSSDSDEEPTRVARQRKRRRVASSSEDESEGGAPIKRARTGGRRAAIVSDEDDDQESEDNAILDRAEAHNSEDEEEDPESDSDAEPHPRPMSLAERLRLNRMQNPIPVSDDESSSSAVPSIRDYEGFQDDDQSTDTGDPGSQEEVLSEDALVDDQADESDEDGW